MIDEDLTRDGWLDAADRLLGALAPFRLDSGAGIRLPGRPSWSGARSDLLEGYARSFLLLAFRVAGAGGADPDDLLPRYREGLIAGTDPDHEDRWIPIVDRGQALVEAASIALGLHLTRPWLWDTLSATERRRVAEWMAPSAHVATADNNWVLFPVVIQEFLAGTGFPADPDVIRGGFARIDGWYEGDGWYRDGDGQNFDYYNAWAMHLYPLLWTRMAAERVPSLATEVRERSEERLAAFLPAHVRFFGADGTPVFQGRSLSYRFAALAPLWLGELHGVSPLSPGQTRRLTSRVLRRFVDGGALDDAGVLASGWLGAFPPMIQEYSGPASPYWASKGFVGLLLPADSPVWSAPGEASPVERSDAERILAGPGWLLSTTASDGIVRLVNHGSDHYPLSGTDAPLYDRLGYSSATAPSFEADPVDQHLAIVDAQGRGSRRGLIERIPDAVPGTLASRHVATVPPDDPSGEPVVVGRIATASLVHGPFAAHLHVVEAEPGRGIRAGGFAVVGAGDDVAAGSGRSEVVGGGLRSGIADLGGGATAGVHRARGASPYGGEAVVPVLETTAASARTVMVVATGLAGPGADAPEPPELLGLVDDERGVRAALRFADGAECELRLPA
ncbi:DUF2264 domain-containing protein [Microbacterium resistens]|uniref:DUF2264 domain-containing protein n=1 Tax=Microbacterium resistens TaxID=156977 RepID=UPI001C56EA82|nr:DUF2264 domain-containing protein [Microbacterium resistens]MBW1641151.1 DUF2264 domain-containing protein [Microbacterium resistens]